MFEMQLAIICASAPAFKVYVAKYLIDPASKFTSRASKWQSYALRSRTGAKSTVSAKSTTQFSTRSSVVADRQAALEKMEDRGDEEMPRPVSSKETLLIEKKMLFSVRFSEVNLNDISPSEDERHAYIRGI